LFYSYDFLYRESAENVRRKPSQDKLFILVNVSFTL
jgi:hypothetical protein